MNSIRKRLLETVFGNITLYNMCRYLVEGGNHKIIKNATEALNMNADETLLEVGSGTGLFRVGAVASYVGIDNDEHIILHAGRKSGSERQLLVMDARKIGFREDSFDKAVMICTIHHMSDEDLILALRGISRVTRDVIVIVDIVIPTKGVMGKIQRLTDMGENFRSLEGQLEIIGSTLDIKKYSKFRSGFYTHSLIICSAKKHDVNKKS